MNNNRRIICRIVYSDAKGKIRWTLGYINKQELISFKHSPNHFLEIFSEGNIKGLIAPSNWKLQNVRSSVIPKNMILKIEIYHRKTDWEFSPSQKAFYKPIKQQN